MGGVGGGLCFFSNNSLVVSHTSEKGNKTTQLHFSHTIVGVVVRRGSIAARRLSRSSTDKKKENKTGWATSTS